MKRLSASFAIIAILVIYIFSGCSKADAPPTVDKLLSLGEKYLVEMDYEQAVVQFLKVIEIDPMNARGYTGAADAYIGLGQTEKAKAVLQQGKSIIGEIEDINELLEELAPEPKAEIPNEANTDEIAETPIDATQYLSELLTQYEDDGSISGLIGSAEFNEVLAQIKEFPFILLNEAGNYGLGLYENGEYIYIGEYLEDFRNGYGVWLCDDGYRFEGEWANDKPNGSGKDNLEWSGTLMDGLWNGIVKTPFSDGIDSYVLDIGFENGTVTVLKTDFDNVAGGTAYPYMVAEFQTPEGQAAGWNWTEAQAARVYGVKGFGDYLRFP